MSHAQGLKSQDKRQEQDSPVYIHGNLPGTTPREPDMIRPKDFRINEDEKNLIIEYRKAHPTTRKNIKLILGMDTQKEEEQEQKKMGKVAHAQIINFK